MAPLRAGAGRASTVNSSPERIGAGAFGYDFGALDDLDNLFTKSYTNLMYGRLSFCIQSEVLVVLIVCPSIRFGAFGNPSQLHLFIIAIMGWFPGLITWLRENSSNPGMKKLKQNMSMGRRVARGLLDSKRQELKDGASRKDVMSLLGLLLPLLYSICMAIESFSSSQI